MNKRTTTNPKRRLRNVMNLPIQAERDSLAARANYGGNPVHKRNPGDFNLIPPSAPRQNKTLCDGANIFRRTDALELLRQGIQRGLISEQERNGWPQNVWAVTEEGVALESQLDNEEIGSYHGYPMLSDEPLADDVVERWNQL
jgi:hypothetical protein